MWECLYLDLLLSNLNFKFLLKFLPSLHAKRKKENTVPCFQAYFFYLSMLGWLRYFTMDLITGSLMLSEIGSQLAHSAILRLLTILEKKVFRICAAFLSLSMISSSSVKVIFDTITLDTILSEKNCLMVFQKVLLSVTFFSSRIL